ncbi:MAG: serine protease [Acidimicrobiia bacterium]|nr:serine protease [Acidimicrobiia bacterium]
MAVKLDGRQRRELRESLMSAFPNWMTLSRMTAENLETPLDTVTSQMKDLKGNTFDLIDWAMAGGQVVDLVVAARNANPGNPELFVFAKKMGLTAADQPTRALEAFVSDNQSLLDVQVWRERMTKAEWAVCRVDIDQVGTGTGLLVGPDAVLTNYHVVEQLIDGSVTPDQVSCLFDFKMVDKVVTAPGQRVGLADKAVIASSPYSQVDLEPDPKSGSPGADELDFALLRLAEPAGDLSVGSGDGGESRGWITVPAGPIRYESMKGIAILQHPNRDPLKLALGMEQNIEVNDVGNRLRYTVPTLPGSSGSPVFNVNWDLVALHHSGDPNLIKPAFNEGIPIGVIVGAPGCAEYFKSLEDC